MGSQTKSNDKKNNLVINNSIKKSPEITQSKLDMQSKPFEQNALFENIILSDFKDLI